MNISRLIALFIAGSYAVAAAADTEGIPTVSIEEAIKNGQALMASHYSGELQLKCFISKVVYKEESPSGYWRIFWSGGNPGSCFAEVRVFSDGEARFVLGY